MELVVAHEVEHSGSATCEQFSVTNAKTCPPFSVNRLVLPCGFRSSTSWVIAQSVITQSWALAVVGAINVKATHSHMAAPSVFAPAMCAY